MNIDHNNDSNIYTINFSLFSCHNLACSIHKSHPYQFTRLRSEIGRYSRPRWVQYISSSIQYGLSWLCISVFDYQSEIIWGHTNYLREAIGCDGQSAVSDVLYFLFYYYFFSFFLCEWHMNFIDCLWTNPDMTTFSFALQCAGCAGWQQDRFASGTSCERRTG